MTTVKFKDEFKVLCKNEDDLVLATQIIDIVSKEAQKEIDYWKERCKKEVSNYEFYHIEQIGKLRQEKEQIKQAIRDYINCFDDKGISKNNKETDIEECFNKFDKLRELVN